MQWLPLSAAVAWALTRDKQFTDRARRAPTKCFVDDNLVYAENEDRNPAPELYFDNAEAALEHVCKEITNGKIKINPPDWRVTVEKTNGSVQVAYAELQSVFPQNGPKASHEQAYRPPHPTKRCPIYVGDRGSLLDRHEGGHRRARYQ